MSASKKRHVDENSKGKRPHEDESSSEESSDEEEYDGDEQIQVDFEGRNPEESDFHGIKQLLRQLFLKAPVDISQLSDIIIKQNTIGSVVKQCDDRPESDDDDEVDQDDVYGVTTVVSLQDKEHLQCTKQLKSYLKQKCDAHAAADIKAKLTNVLESETLQTGLLLNERFVNIPPQISVPLLKNLSKEIKKANEKKLLPCFDYYVLLCKVYKMNPPKSKKKGKRSGDSDLPSVWSNAEEELIAEMADCSFEFSVKGDADTGLGGTWKESDNDMIPWRRVILLQAKSLDTWIQKIVECTS